MQHTPDIDRSILAAFGLIGDDDVVSDVSPSPLPLGSVRVAEVDITIPVLGRPRTVTVTRIVSTLPPAGSTTRYH